MNHITQKLAVDLQICHSVLNIAWPQPGKMGMQGAGVYIGTNLYTCLERITAIISESLNVSFVGEQEKSLISFWKEFEALVHRLSLSTAGENEVDAAFNLLYLASGVAFHWIQQSFNAEWQQDENYLKVEDLNRLVQRCNFEPASPLALLLENIESSMRCSLRATNESSPSLSAEH